MTAPRPEGHVERRRRLEGGSDAAATVVRAFASTATSIPHNPDAIEVNPPTRKATVVEEAFSEGTSDRGQDEQ